jgi:hypothetical protein
MAHTEIAGPAVQANSFGPKPYTAFFWAARAHLNRHPTPLLTGRSSAFQEQMIIANGITLLAVGKEEWNTFQMPSRQ